MANVIKMQMYALFNRKSTVFMYIVMCGLVVLNFIKNLIQYAGYNYWNMYHPVKLVFLSDYSSFGFFFLQFYPFLVVIPAAFTYFADKNSRMIVFVETRTSKAKYYIGTMIATFATTFLIFTIPFLMEVLLNYVAYPSECLGDPSNVDSFAATYHDMVDQYLFGGLWNLNAYVYTIAMIILFGVCSGVLASFTLALSMVIDFKFRVLLFVPVYVLLYGLSVSNKVLHLEFETSYFSYLRIFSGGYLYESAYLGVIGLLVLISCGLLVFKIRKDEVL